MTKYYNFMFSESWIIELCLLDPINIYCLCGTIGIIGVNLQSKNPSFFATAVPLKWYYLLLVCLHFPCKDMTHDWDN